MHYNAPNADNTPPLREDRFVFLKPREFRPLQPLDLKIEPEMIWGTPADESETYHVPTRFGMWHVGNYYVNGRYIRIIA